jgi:hypothetical protein
MANCIAKCTGYDKSRQKSDHRLGSEAALGEASTWHTEAYAYVTRDGIGYVEVHRNGKTIHRFDFDKE